MTKLEKFLIDHGLAEKKRYPVGTVIYGFCDNDGFYGYDEVYVQPGRHFELSVGYPYIILLDAARPSAATEEAFINDKLFLLQKHLRWAIKFRDQLNAIENPWEEADD